MPDGPFEEAAELTILMESASAFQKLIQIRGDCAGLTDPLGQINGYASQEFSRPPIICRSSACARICSRRWTSYSTIRRAGDGGRIFGGSAFERASGRRFGGTDRKTSAGRSFEFMRVAGDQRAVRIE